MIEEQRGTPHGAILAVVVTTLVVVPSLIGDQLGEAATDFVAELLSPVGLLLLPIVLLLVIQVLSSDFGSLISIASEPHSIHRAGGSPVGVALFVVLFLFLLYNRGVSIFGGDDDSGD